MTQPMFHDEQDWHLTDGGGLRHDRRYFCGESDWLSNGQLLPGESVAGTLIFSAPTTDQQLTVVMQNYQLQPAVWELY